MTVQIAVIGDIHLHFSAADVAYFNQSAHDLILFVGDLSEFNPRKGLPIARLIAQLKKPTLFIPGNHDGVGLVQLVAEAYQIPLLKNLTAVRQHRRVAQLRTALDNTIFGGYSTHSFTINDLSFDVIVGRPFSMGGPQLTFKPYLQRHYQINTLKDSVSRLQACVNQAQSERLIFLAHNGPAGLGNGRSDIWGCDFKKEGGDFGDPDLQAAITYAQKQSKQVTAVIAGHMHHQTKNDGQRTALIQQNGTTYVNAAQVPRIIPQNGTQIHHYIHIELNEQTITITPQYHPDTRN